MLACLLASSNPYHPGPSKHVSGEERTAAPQPAAPRQTQGHHLTALLPLVVSQTFPRLSSIYVLQ